MSHVKFNSAIQLNPSEEKVIAAKVDRFSDAVTLILRNEAAAKLKKLVYVFIAVNQSQTASLSFDIDDSRDKISATSRDLIKSKFEEIFSR